jgi:hypothetical protein
MRMGLLARDRRKDVVKMLAAKGLSTREIADITGWHHSTIAEDLRVGNPTKTVGNPTAREAKEAEIREANEELKLVEVEPVTQRYGTSSDCGRLAAAQSAAGPAAAGDCQEARTARWRSEVGEGQGSTWTVQVEIQHQGTLARPHGT